MDYRLSSWLPDGRTGRLGYIRGRGTIELQVLGQALVVNGNLAKAQELAVADGLRQAAEQAVGSLVYSETKVENYQLIKDTIRLRSAGYISGYEINKVWVEQNICKVFLTVRVKKGTMIQDLEELRLNLMLAGNPGIMLSITAEDQRLSTGGFTTVIMEGLQAAGYNRVFDQKQPAARQQGALLVTGEVFSEKLGSYQGLVSCRVTLQVRMVKADTGESLGSYDLQQTEVDLTERAAAEKALRRASERLLPLILADLSKNLTAPRSLTLSVMNLTYPQVTLFRQYLRETPMVDRVQLHEYTGRKAVLSVETTLTAPQLADELLGWDEFILEVTGVSPYLIELMVMAVGSP